MKPALYDEDGRPTHWHDDAGKLYTSMKPEQFAPWDGNPLKIIEPVRVEPGQTLTIITEPVDASGGYRRRFPYAGEPPLHEQVADKAAIAHAKQPREPLTFWKPKWAPPEPPEVIAVKETMNATQRKRAETMRRLGGGPIVKAQRVAKDRVVKQQDADIKALLDGLRSRPVL
jgi:hypothetical protein